MRISIEINDDELRDVVIQKVARELTDSIMRGRIENRVFREEIKNACKKAVNENFENLVTSAVKYAGDKIVRNCAACPLAAMEKTR